MARAYFTGNLSDGDDTSDIHVGQDKYTGAIGILCTGTFASGSIAVRAGKATPDLSHPYLMTKPSTGAKIALAITAEGLYYVPGFFEDVKLVLSGGTPSTTDIDWTIFLKPRP